MNSAYWGQQNHGKTDSPLPSARNPSAMVTVASLRLTNSAKLGIRSLGMKNVDALGVIQGLTRRDFYKSMTTHADHRVWQDVYHAEWRGLGVYVKFQQDADRYFFTLSFKAL
ncbi:type II toxin-antitoxin system MqsR family toxin [Methylomagnum sp.]